MQTDVSPGTYTAPAAVVDKATEDALKDEQDAQRRATGKKPNMAQVVASVLIEWGKNRQEPA